MTDDRIDHTEITEQLSDFMEGDLGAEAHDRVEAHLAGCGVCRRVLAELRAVASAARGLEPIEPPRDLWAGIAATIEAPVAVAPRDTKVIALPTAEARGSSPREDVRALEAELAPRRFTFSTPQLAAAAVVLIAASSLATWTAGPGLAEGPAAAVTETAPTGPVAMVSDAPAPPAELADELATLERTLEGARAALDPNTVRVLERNLAVIEQAIEDSRLALAQDPGNEFLAAHLERVYERKLTYLRDAARVADRSS